MPSWCSNDITIVGTQEQLTKLKKKVSNTKKEQKEYWTGVAELNFNKAFPCPPILTRIHSGSTNIDGVQYRNWIEINEKGEFGNMLNKGEVHLSFGLNQEQLDLLQEKYGATCQYDWEVNNYDTKWGASDFTGVDNEFVLVNSETQQYKWEVYGDTAWGVAEGLWQKICNDFGVSMKIHFGGEVESGIFVCVPQPNESQQQSGYIEVDLENLSV